MPSSKRQRELARRRMERQAERRAAADAARKRRNRMIVGGVFVATLLLVGGVWAVPRLTGDDDGDPSAEPTGTPSASASASPTIPGKCDGANFTKAEGENSAGKKPGLPGSKDWGETKTVPATITLTQGTVKADLFAEKAPCTVWSFTHLASKNFFDNTKCHRLTTSGIFVLQCGDPTGSGSGGPGYTIPDENLTGATYPAGTIAMANTGAPHSGGSQFFICYKDTQLPPNYAPFGKITSGLDVVLKISEKGVTGGGGDGAPAEEVTMKDFVVTA